MCQLVLCYYILIKYTKGPHQQGRNDDWKGISAKAREYRDQDLVCFRILQYYLTAYDGIHLCVYLSWRLIL